MSEPAFYGRLSRKVLVVSGVALAVPVIATFLPGADAPWRPLLWLLALTPVFLLAHDNGARGAAVAAGAGTAVLVLAHLLALAGGRQLPGAGPLLAVLVAFIAVAAGIGWITELLHRRYGLAQESGAEATLALTAAGVIRQASPAARGVLGYDSAELEGTHIGDLLEPSSRNDLLPRLNELREGETIELRVRDDRGEARLLDVLVKDRRNDPAQGGFLFRARDITAQRNAEEQARRAARMETIGALAGALAHDFNNALTTIRGNAELLREDLADNTSAQTQLLEIEQAADRSARVVQMLLAFTRQQVLRPEPISLAALLAEARPKLEELLGPEVQVATSVADDVPDVYFDPVRLHRILLLLAARAGESMPGGGRFTIDATSVEIDVADARRFPYPVTPGDYALLVVRDTGKALSEAEVASIFEPFAVTVGDDATGLELSSVYGTIKQAGGYVWVASGPEGTAFRIHLPLAIVPLPLLPEPDAPGERVGSTVLVVEDDAAVRAIVRETLLRRGYFVVEAEDGEDALQVVEKMGTRPDAMVTDLMMPNIGGRELARELARRYGSFPVLFISGYTQEAAMAGSLLQPGERLLSKPFSPQQLADALAELRQGVTHT